MMANIDGFFQVALSIIAVLLLASLSGYASERAGVVNIGIEGMMVVGALIFSIIGATAKFTNLNQIWVALIAALTAAVFALLHGFASITLKADQTISGTAINVLAGGIALVIVTSGAINDDATKITAGFSPVYFDSSNVVPMWFVIAIAIALVLFLFFKFTKVGMRYKMVGENPNAVDAAGISVNKYRYSAVFLSGFIAGLAGAILVTTPVLSGSFTGTVNGYGFLGLAILIFGQWKIIWMTLGATLFSMLFALGYRIGSFVDPNSAIAQTSLIWNVVPFLLTIFMMVVTSKWSKAPAADGVPFDKAMR